MIRTGANGRGSEWRERVANSTFSGWTRCELLASLH